MSFFCPISYLPCACMQVHSALTVQRVLQPYPMQPCYHCCMHEYSSLQGPYKMKTALAVLVYTIFNACVNSDFALVYVPHTQMINLIFCTTFPLYLARSCSAICCIYILYACGCVVGCALRAIVYIVCVTKGLY